MASQSKWLRRDSLTVEIDGFESLRGQGYKSYYLHVVYPVLTEIRQINNKKELFNYGIHLLDN